MPRKNTIFFLRCPQANTKDNMTCPSIIEVQALVRIAGNPIPVPGHAKFCELCGSGLILYQRKCSCGNAAGMIFCSLCGDKLQDIEIERFKSHLSFE